MTYRVWLTSFWGFDPGTWGGLGFTRPADRDNFISQSPDKSLVAVYVTKAKGPEEMRGRIVGLLEITHEKAPMRQLTSPTEWAQAQDDHASRDKWTHGLRASRAWWIAPEERPFVDELLPKTYASTNAQIMGARGAPVEESEISGLLSLTLAETPVYRQFSPIEADFTTFEEVLLPSRAIHPGIGGRWIGEPDGPKYLYILRLAGNYEHFLGRRLDQAGDMHIIKVGFSKSPHLRRRQIQSAYPACAFSWEVYRPEEIPTEAPFENAEEAIVGEDAMKERLINYGAQSLGGEFFLVNDDQLVHGWNAGRFALEVRKKLYGARGT